jgi:hypothetical protein
MSDVRQHAGRLAVARTVNTMLPSASLMLPSFCPNVWHSTPQ